MKRYYESDRIQCQAISPKTKKRCSSIATYSNGGKALCAKHQALAIKTKESQK